MTKLYISATKDSPEISFDPKTGLFCISGVSHPENVTKFFQPVIEWLDNFHAEVVRTRVSTPIKLVLFFRYINSASYKYLISFLQRIQELTNDGVPVSVEWQYEPEDVDMKEAGTELFEYSGIKLPYTCSVNSEG
jgi:hypothetical protein